MTRAKGPTFRVAFRRRREGKTNYAKRLALVKSGKPRMVVRKSNMNMLVQFIEYATAGDKTLVSANSKMLKDKFNWPSKRNVWTAYLTGLYAASEAKKKNITEFVLDLGLHPATKGSVLFASLKGAVDGGLKTSFEEKMIPLVKLSNPPEEYKKAFEDLKKRFLSS